MREAKKVCLLNPGPVTLTRRVRQALLRPDLCHREPEFTALQTDVRQGLVRVYPGLEDRYTADEVLQSLRTLADSGVLLTRGDHHLSLAVLRNRPAAPPGPHVVAYASTAPDSDALLRVLRPA